MRLEIREGAVEDLKRFEKRAQEQIRDEIKELETNPLGENTSLLSKQGLELFRLKLKSGELDHRVFFDLDGGKVVVLGVEHRDHAYTEDSMQNIRSRT